MEKTRLTLKKAASSQLIMNLWNLGLQSEPNILASPETGPEDRGHQTWTLRPGLA